MSEMPNPPQPSPPPNSAQTDLAQRERELKEQLDQPDKNPRDILWQLARLYNATKRHDEAVQCLRRIFACESDLERKAGCALALGATMEQRNDFRAAIRYYREAMALEPMRNDAWYWIHNNLGYSYNQVGQFDEGEKCCRAAIQIDSSRPNGYKNLGIALGARGKYQEAAINYITATFRHGGDTRSFKLLQELIREHPELAVDFQNEYDRCEKIVRFAAVALERARAGRPFKVLLGSANLESLNSFTCTLMAISGGAAGIQVAVNLSQFIEAAENGDFDLGFLAPGGFPGGSASGTSTGLWEQAARAIRQIKSQKPIALVLVGTTEELSQHEAVGRTSGASAMLDANQGDALVDMVIHLLSQK